MNIEAAWPDPTDAWSEYIPSSQESWDTARAIHLRKRTGFGTGWGQNRRDVNNGYEKTIQRVIDGDTHGSDGRPADEIAEVAEVLYASATRAGNVERLQLAWLYRLVYSAHPLVERMLFAWHDRYASSVHKVGDADSMSGYHTTQRRLWRASARTLHRAMLADHAMQSWLDNTESRKKHPNENLAREFLELFALGEGNYTEHDIQEIARALTGWRTLGGRGPQIRFFPESFDDGDKTIFGQTGRWGLDDVARLATALPAAGSHLARFLFRTFISNTDKPADGFLAPLVRAMRTADGDLDVARGIETVLRSRVFHSMACRGKHVKDPLDFVIGTLRSCEMCSPPVDMTEVNRHLVALELNLFHAPSVAGWPKGLDWLTPSGLIARANFAAVVGSQSLRDENSADDGESLGKRLRQHGLGDLKSQTEALAGVLLGESLSDGVAASVAPKPAGSEDPTLAVARRLLSLPQAQLC